MINCPFKEYKKTGYVATAIAAVTAGYYALKYYRARKSVNQAKAEPEAPKQE